MKVTVYKIERVPIAAFADKHGLEMSVRECPWGYAASFENAEIKDGACLVGSYGKGDTPAEAIQHYAREISGKLLVIGACTKGRREIGVPTLRVAKKRSPVGSVRS